jgi:hypothetical protein
MEPRCGQQDAPEEWLAKCTAGIHAFQRFVNGYADSRDL